MTVVQMIEANWQIFAAAVAILLVLVLLLISRSRKPREREWRSDVLDEGAAPAQRNQALIDAPPAAAVAAPSIVPPVAPLAAAGTLAGIGEVVAHAAREETIASREAEAPASSETDALEAEDAAQPDDLRRIKGLGPKLVATLQALGITRFDQIAVWTDADLDDLDTKLGAFAGRPRRDAWVEQAQLLASSDTAAYEARFGKL